MAAGPSGGAWSWLRDARWLTARRAAVYGALLALLPAFYLFAGFVRVFAADGVGAPTDFLSFYTASVLALDGRPVDAWDLQQHGAVQQAIMPSGRLPFFYPPPFLLLCLPLALLSYKVAFGLWVLITGGAFVAILSRYRVLPWPAIIALVAFSPATLLVAVAGQTGFVTASLFAAAGLTLDRRPMAAGALIATLAFKPQLGLVVLPALLVGRRWQVIAFAVATGIGWVALSSMVLGWESWTAFASALRVAGEGLSGDGVVPLWQVQSLFASLQLLGAPRGVAMGVHLVVALGAVAAALWVVTRRPGGQGEVAAMAAAAPLVTPYVFVYDLPILLVPMFWCLAQARQAGFLAWEKFALATAIILPAPTMYIGQTFGISLGPIPAAIVLALVLRRAGILARRTA